MDISQLEKKYMLLKIRLHEEEEKSVEAYGGPEIYDRENSQAKETIEIILCTICALAFTYSYLIFT